MTASLLRSVLLAAAAALAAGPAAPAPDWPPVHQLRADGDHAPRFAPLIARVAGKPTVRSVVGPTDTPLPLELVNFLLDRPALAAFIVARRGIAPYRVEMLDARRSTVDDGEGASGVIDMVSRAETVRLYYGEGRHDGRLLPALRAAAVVDLTLEPLLGADCRPVTRTSLRVYVRLRSRVMSGLVKTFRPLLKDAVVRKFGKAFLVADQVGRLMQRDPEGVAQDALAFGALSEQERADLARMMAALAAPPRCPDRPAGEFH